jgi:hypothetical protein
VVLPPPVVLAARLADKANISNRLWDPPTITRPDRAVPVVFRAEVPETRALVEVTGVQALLALVMEATDLATPPAIEAVAVAVAEPPIV